MSTRQLEANRRNAARSTGPKTEAGKAASSKNALSHGFTARTVVLSTEDDKLFLAVRQELHNELRPVGLIETGLVDEIAAARWRQRRCARFETGLLENRMAELTRDLGSRFLDLDPDFQAVVGFKTLSDGSKGLRDASLYEYRHRRNYEKAMKELEARQKVRKQAEEAKAPVPESEPEMKDVKAEIKKVKNEPIPKIEHLEMNMLPAPEPPKQEDEWPKAS